MNKNGKHVKCVDVHVCFNKSQFPHLQELKKFSVFNHQFYIYCY